MSKRKFNLSINNILTCAFYAVIGLLLVILQGGSLNILMTIIGALFLLLGVVDMFKNDLAKGLVEAVIGVVIIVCGWLIVDIVLLVFGALLIVKGVMELIKNAKASSPALISPIVTIVIGVLLVVAKWTLMDVMCIVAGVIFLLNAVLALFGKSITK